MSELGQKIRDFIGAVFLLITVCWMLIYFGNRHHPVANDPKVIFDQLETDALFYSESPETVRSSYILKKKLKK